MLRTQVENMGPLRCSWDTELLPASAKMVSSRVMRVVLATSIPHHWL